jgi:hypothetical protein
MDGFCRSWSGAYDAVFYCQDHYAISGQRDPYRSKVAHLQAQADEMVRAEYARLSQPLALVPKSLDVGDRARWVVAQMKMLNLVKGETTDDH